MAAMTRHIHFMYICVCINKTLISQPIKIVRVKCPSFRTHLLFDVRYQFNFKIYFDSDFRIYFEFVLLICISNLISV